MQFRHTVIKTQKEFPLNHGSIPPTSWNPPPRRSKFHQSSGTLPQFRGRCHQVPRTPPMPDDDPIINSQPHQSSLNLREKPHGGNLPAHQRTRTCHLVQQFPTQIRRLCPSLPDSPKSATIASATSPPRPHLTPQPPLPIRSFLAGEGESQNWNLPSPNEERMARRGVGGEVGEGLWYNLRKSQSRRTQ